jgi:hypothetical protein
MGEFVKHSEVDHEWGLHCNVPAFTLKPPLGNRRVKNVVWFRCPATPETYRVTHSLGPNPGPSPEDLEIDKLASPAILLSGPVTREQGAIGALIDISKISHGDGRRHARYHTRVFVNVEMLENVLNTLSDVEKVKDLLVEGQQILADKWCIY